VDRESLRVLLAQGLSVEKIAERFDRHPTTVSYWMRRHGLQAVNRDKYAAKGGIERELLEALVRSGASIGEIAVEVGRSKGTVRHWLTRYGLRTAAARRAVAAGEARGNGVLAIRRACPRHGETEFVLEGRGYYRCKRCRAEGVASHRRRLKLELFKEAGGRCRICGYRRCISALEFHHLEAADKRLGVSAGGLTLSLETLRSEVRKCVLLCSNCHAEVEAGVTALP
jgi:transposase